ncbi:MAG: methylated-DNA--[protein]-cysteine S-methyltransferase [Opitutales bacterium]
MAARIKPFAHLRYGQHTSPFGSCVIGVVEDRLACLAFTGGREAGAAVIETRAQAQGWRTVLAEKETAPLAELIFEASDRALGEAPLELSGTPFQRRVWQALRELPRGQTTCYGELARQVGRPGAARAVGAAVGANPIAYVVPCHRVVRKDGRLGGFRWGVALKRCLLQAEGAIPP